jgi:NAD(P)-dependent dehydrogenase (short-subunit alcohol dehydrogenase family)
MTPAALVTGASSGIGRATALRLDAEGWTVFAGVRDSSAGNDLVAAASGPGTLEPVRLDVTDQGSVAATAAAISESMGDEGLRGLVNNAGIGAGGPLEYVALENLRGVLEVNVVGQVAVTQAMLPLLRRGHGRIVFTSSDNGRWAPPFMGPYAASKFALEAVGDALRVELRKSKIPVSIVEPGSIRTSIWDKGLDGIERGELNLPEESKRHYGDVTTVLQNALEEGKKNAIPAERVAEAIHHALSARRPKTRYRIGRDAHTMIMLRAVLPDRAFDSAVSRIIERFEKS